MTGQIVVKMFASRMRRQPTDSTEPTSTSGLLDEENEVLDAGGFWDETAEVLLPQAALAV